jgi:hypothetical protein
VCKENLIDEEELTLYLPQKMVGKGISWKKKQILL